MGQLELRANIEQLSSHASVVARYAPHHLIMIIACSHHRERAAAASIYMRTKVRNRPYHAPGTQAGGKSHHAHGDWRWAVPCGCGNLARAHWPGRSTTSLLGAFGGR